MQPQAMPKRKSVVKGTVSNRDVVGMEGTCLVRRMERVSGQETGSTDLVGKSYMHYC